jgi:hypothetical protein
MHIQEGGRGYDFITSLDVDVRYIMHHELALGMDGLTVGRGSRTIPNTCGRLIHVEEERVVVYR